MKPLLRIAIDCRRGLGSGVGRVTQSLVRAVLKLSDSRPIIPVLLMASDVQMSGIERLAELAEIRHISIPLHSDMDRLEYPELLTYLKIDVFFAPQYYIAPFSQSLSIRYVHDLWPLFHPEWIPTPSEFGTRFGFANTEESLRFAANFLQTPPVDFVNNQHISCFVKRNKKNPVAVYYGVMFYLALKLSNKIIVPSQHTLNEIRAVFPSALPKVSVIPNAVDPTFVLREPLASLKERDPTILHVANWEPRKNIECLLNAFKHLCDSGLSASLELVGTPGTSNYAKKIHRMIARHHYRESIRVHGFIHDDALANLFRTALVFVCSSHYEGFCIPVLEAMASGLPVIASDRAALPEICRDAALFFKPNDPVMLAKQLITLLTNTQLREGFAVKGLANICRFSIDAFAQSIGLLIHHSEEPQT
jgi:glycosyltransferase involved in cell wall biosynthesis